MTTPPDRLDRGCHGIDIGGTKIEIASYDAAMREAYRERVATPGHDIAAFSRAVHTLVRNGDAVLGARAPAGIGLPGITDTFSGRQLSTNVPALNGRQARQLLQHTLDRPIVVGNDCQCFALCEAAGGAADGLPTMFGAILGTGAGGGYCADGKLVRGQNGIAGEWGHWSVPAPLLARHGLALLDCPCGKAGCTERYVSGPGMAALHRHFGGDGAEPVALAARANAGDIVAARTLDVHLDLLGHALANVVLAFDPHAIVLGGGLSNLPHLYARLPDAVQRHLLRGIQAPPILPPRFGDAGGARGAALLLRQQLDASPHP
jgi:N-acetylglucosamine kinase